MTKIKLLKKNSQHGNILNKGKRNFLKLTPREKIELDVIHFSIKTDVLC